MAEKQKDATATGSQGGQWQDVMSKEIFGNRELCAQFLRDYVDMPFLKDVQAEDIETFDQRYHFFDSVELNSDTVKKVKLKNMEAGELFIALIEHKSSPDYDVSMQFLQYITCIWYNWAKAEKERLGGKEDVNKRASFRYPPILPIVYYEGAKNWKEAPELKDRILLQEDFAPYIPNFQYYIIRNREFTNEELLSKKDEISLLMLINKIQKRDDFKLIRDIPAERMKGILAQSSASVLDTIAATVQSLCHKLNLPDEETARYVEKVKERDMGYLWENMEPMDIQAERKNTQEAMDKLREAEEKLEQAKTERDRAKAERDEAKQERDQAKATWDETKIELENSKETISKQADEIQEKNARIFELEKELLKLKKYE